MATILIADDSEDDVVLLRRALESAGVTNAFTVLQDGNEVLKYLGGEPPFDNREKYPLPPLLFLDLKLSRRDGFEVLSWIRSHAELHNLQVFVVSGRDDLGTVRRAYELGATSFLRKPYDPVDLENLLRGFPQFWTRALPSP